MLIFSLCSRFSKLCYFIHFCSIVINDRGKLFTKDKIGRANELVSLRLVSSQNKDVAGWRALAVSSYFIYLTSIYFLIFIYTLHFFAGSANNRRTNQSVDFRTYPLHSEMAVVVVIWQWMAEVISAARAWDSPTLS